MGTWGGGDSNTSLTARPTQTGLGHSALTRGWKVSTGGLVWSPFPLAPSSHHCLVVSMVTPRGLPSRIEVGLSHPPPQLTHSDRAATAATAPTKPPQGGPVTPSLSPCHLYPQTQTQRTAGQNGTSRQGGPRRRYPLVSERKCCCFQEKGG